MLLEVATHLAQLARPQRTVLDISGQVSSLERVCGRQVLSELQDRGRLELQNLRDTGLILADVHGHRAVRRRVAAQQLSRLCR